MHGLSAAGAELGTCLLLHAQTSEEADGEAAERAGSGGEEGEEGESDIPSEPPTLSLSGGNDPIELVIGRLGPPPRSRSFYCCYCCCCALWPAEVCYSLLA